MGSGENFGDREGAVLSKRWFSYLNYTNRFAIITRNSRRGAFCRAENIPFEPDPGDAGEGIGGDGCERFMPPDCQAAFFVENL
jgi:hypothetical protein